MDKISFRENDRDNLELVRQIVLSRLRQEPQWCQFDRTWASQTVVDFESSNMRSRFVVLANEVIWELIIQRVLTVGRDQSNPDLPFFRVTDYGKRVLEVGTVVPQDPAGYLDKLKTVSGLAPTDVTIAYVQEALQCFNSGLHLASVLLLGVASEAAFNRMCNIIRPKLKPTEQSKLREELPVKQRHRWILAKYVGLASKVRREQLPESLDVTLGSIYDLIRKQRNELGHPRQALPRLDRELAFAYFQIFPSWISDIQAFADYCSKHGI